MKLNDSNVKQKLIEAQEKLSELKERFAQKPKYLTSGYFMINDQRYSLFTANTPDALAETLAEIVKETDAKMLAYSHLGLHYSPMFQDYPVHSWIDDARTRLEWLVLRENIKKVESIVNKLNRLVSADLRKQMEFDDVLSELGEV